jgi:hypothetical protein
VGAGSMGNRAVLRVLSRDIAGPVTHTCRRGRSLTSRDRPLDTDGAGAIPGGWSMDRLAKGVNSPAISPAAPSGASVKPEADRIEMEGEHSGPGHLRINCRDALTA